MAICNPGGELSLELALVAPDYRLPASGTVKNKCLLFKLPAQYFALVA